MSFEPGSKTNPLVLYIGARKLAIFEGEVGLGEPKIKRYDILPNPEGFQNGLVTNLERAAHSVQSLMDHFLKSKAEESIQMYVVLANPKLKSYGFSSSQYYQGGQRAIGPSDVRSVVKQTRSVATLPLSETVLQAIPESFLVNDMPEIRNPIGLEAHRLGVRLKMFTMNYEDFKNVAKIFDVVDVEVLGYYPKTLLVSEAVLTDKEKEEGVLVIDIADDMTYLMVWKNLQMVANRVVELGGKYLTSRIAAEWQIEMHDAEKVKERYASLISDPKFAEELIPLVERGGKGNHQVKRQDFQQRFTELCRGWLSDLLERCDQFVKEEKVLYPHYVLTGGGTSLDGFLEFLQSQFNRSARIGCAHRLQAPQELLTDSSLAAPLGMYRWLAEREPEQRRLFSTGGFFERVFTRIRDWFAAYF